MSRLYGRGVMSNPVPKAGEARRWTLHAANVLADVVTGDRLRLGERVRVREDKACQEDVEKVMRALFDLEGDEPATEIEHAELREMPDVHADLKAKALTVLNAVFGGGSDDNE